MTSEPKILVLDIERVPMFTKPLPVWTMGDLRNHWLRADEIESWGRTICLAYRWQGDKQIRFIAEWHEGRKAFLQKAWDLYDEADIVVGHNIVSFDTPHLQGEWLLEDMNLPSPVRQVDTLKLARKGANWEANHLDILDKRFGNRGKSDKYRIQLAMDAVNGDPKAQGKIERYNAGDIRATERVYHRLRPLSKVNVGLFIDDEQPLCPACGGTKLQRRGYSVTGVSVFPRYRCMTCGKWMRGKKSERIVELRPE
jgi:hypothetical protein